MKDRITIVENMGRELYETEGSPRTNNNLLEDIKSWFQEDAEIPDKYNFIVKKLKKNKQTFDKLRENGASNKELYRLLISNLNSFAQILRLKKRTKYAVRRFREEKT
jgi:hypothetical protein